MLAPISFSAYSSLQRRLLPHAQFAPQPKQVATLLDADGTLVPWTTHNKAVDELALQGNISPLRQRHQQVMNILTTGRGIEAIQMVAPFTKGLPLDYVILNDGKALYENKHHMPSEEWLLDLGPKDPTWDHYVSKVRGWNIQALLDTLKQDVQAEGFVLANDTLAEERTYKNTDIFSGTLPGHYQAMARLYNGIVLPFRKLAPKNKDLLPIHIGLVFEFANDESVFLIKPKEGPLSWLHKTYAKRLGDKLAKQLSAKFKPSFHCLGQLGGRLIAIHPDGLNKATILPYLTQQKEPQLNALIPAGDDLNDTPMLQFNPEGLDVYPIATGTRLDIASLKKHNPFAVHAPERGHIGGALQTQLDQIAQKGYFD